MLFRALLVGLGGFVGASTRYLLNESVARMLPRSMFPWATFAANVTGCFAIGVLGGLLIQRAGGGEGMRLFAIVGILGGFTTFSSFGLETWILIRDGQLALAGTNAVGQLTLGVLGVAAGLWAARSLG